MSRPTTNPSALAAFAKGAEPASVAPINGGSGKPSRTRKRSAPTPAASAPPSDALSVAQVAELLGISQQALRVRISEGRVPSESIFGRRIIPRAALTEWLDARAAELESEASRLRELIAAAGEAPTLSR
jgi:excisionase family DNA binding protein